MQFTAEPVSRQHQPIGFTPNGMNEDDMSYEDLEALFREIDKEFFAGEFVSRQSWRDCQLNQPGTKRQPCVLTYTIRPQRKNAMSTPNQTRRSFLKSAVTGATAVVSVPALNGAWPAARSATAAAPSVPAIPWQCGEYLCAAIQGLDVVAVSLAEMMPHAPEWDEWRLDQEEIAEMITTVEIQLHMLRQIVGTDGPPDAEVERIRRHNRQYSQRDLPGQARAAIALDCAASCLRTALTEAGLLVMNAPARKTVGAIRWTVDSLRAIVGGQTNGILPDWDEIE